MFLKTALNFPTESTDGLCQVSSINDFEFSRLTVSLGSPPNTYLFCRTQCFHGLCGSVLRDPTLAWHKGGDSEPYFPFGLHGVRHSAPELSESGRLGQTTPRTSSLGTS